MNTRQQFGDIKSYCTAAKVSYQLIIGLICYNKTFSNIEAVDVLKKTGTHLAKCTVCHIHQIRKTFPLFKQEVVQGWRYHLMDFINTYFMEKY